MEYKLELETDSGFTCDCDEIFTSLDKAEERAFELNERSGGAYSVYRIRGFF